LRPNSSAAASSSSFTGTKNALYLPTKKCTVALYITLELYKILLHGRQVRRHPPLQILPRKLQVIPRKGFPLVFAGAIGRSEAKQILRVPRSFVHGQNGTGKRIVGVGIGRAPVFALARPDHAILRGQHPDKLLRAGPIGVQCGVALFHSGHFVAPRGELAKLLVLLFHGRPGIAPVIGLKGMLLREFSVGPVTGLFHEQIAHAKGC